jgi:hypothetical protein
MARFLFWFIAGFVAVWWLRRLSQPGRSARNGASMRRPAPSQRLVVEKTVACETCGLHLPQQEALQGERGRWYCSAAHRQAAFSETSAFRPSD